MGQQVMKRVWPLVFGILFSLEAGAWAQTDPAQVAKGEKVYLEKKCALCHAIKGKGGTAGPAARGPELSDVGAKRESQWLKTFMKDPRTVVPKAKMLPFKGNDEELEALVGYLGSLK